MIWPRVRVIGILLLLLSAAPGMAIAQVSPPQNPVPTPPPPAGKPAASQTTTATDESQSDLDRIRQGLLKLPAVRFDQPAMTFYGEAQAPANKSFADIVGTFDLMQGLVPSAAPNHQDMMSYWQSKNFTASQRVTVGQALSAAFINIGIDQLRKLIERDREALKSAATDEEAKRIQAQIDRELAALAEQQKKGGGGE
jgi:hypothetical protein